MATTSDKLFFGPFEVTSQVFLQTPHSFSLVNLKPLLPGHVLVCPRVPHARLTDMAPAELMDLFTTTQRVQRMLARKYFSPAKSEGSGSVAQPTDGSFNVAIQDGPQAGQTVPHVHVHVIPRPRGEKGSDPAGVEAMDAVYKGMASEDGNVGGALWDAAKGDALQQKGQIERPTPGGEFPDIEEAMRNSRSMEEMNAEADMFREILREMGE